MALGRIADYELLELLGRGGMGVVYKARDIRLGRTVALKLLDERLMSSAEHRARFLREAHAEASLNHAAIATCYDVGEAPLDPPDLLSPDTPGPHPARSLFLSMEFVPGSDLLELVDGRPLRIDRVLDLGAQIAAGLEAAHAAGVVHRDLKPTNVRVTPEGQVKILDFGLARVLRDAAPGTSTPSLETSDGKILGTVLYMSPEQAEGMPADARSDLFSLGVILYQLMTGRLPFQGVTNLGALYAVANEDPPPLARYASGVPDEFERIVRKLLAKRPGDRYQSAHEVRTDLERLRQGLPRSRRHPAWRREYSFAAAIVVLAAAGWWSWAQLGPRARVSVAVLPFENRTGDLQFADVGDGLAANVLGQLVRGNRVNVASFASTRGVPQDERRASHVAHELGVQAVLDGSLRYQGATPTLDLELVDGRNGFVRWTGHYAYTFEGALKLEREIAAQVVSHIAGGRAEAQPMPGTEPATMTAYALYLRAGGRLENPDDPYAPERALELFDQAIGRDSTYALAWTGRSHALLRIWNRTHDTDSLGQAERAAERALRLSPTLPEARVALAQVYRATGRYAESIRELERVTESNSNWDEAQLQLAASYRESGDLVRAGACLRRAIDIRPAYWKNWNSLGALLQRRGDYAGARRAFEQIVRLVPEKNRGYEQLAAMALFEGDFAGAISYYERLPLPVGDAELASNVGTAYFFARHDADARRYYQLAVELAPHNYVTHMNLGDLHVRAGHPDSAHACYRDALRVLDEVLQVTPANALLQLERALLLAKAGDCPRAEATLRRYAATLPAADADCAHVIAQLQALCGHDAEALESLRHAVALGVSPRALRAEDEFANLVSTPAFRELRGPAQR